jgi:hypothetical protein
MLRLINTQREQNKTTDALQTANDLIEIDPYNLNYVCKKLNLIESSKDSSGFLDSIKNSFKNSYEFNNIIAETAFENFAENTKNSYFDLSEIGAFIDRSLSLNVSLDNFAWTLSVKLENEIYDKSNDKNKHAQEQTTQNYLAKIDSLCSNIEKINPEHLRRFIVLENKLSFLTDFAEIETACEELMTIFKSSNITKKNKIIEYIQRVTSCSCDYKNSNTRSDFLEGLLKSDFFENCKALDNSSYYILIADYQLALLKDKTSAIQQISLALKTSNAHKHISHLTNFLCNVENSPEKAFNLLYSKRKDISQTRYHTLMSDIYLSKNQFDKALSELEIAFKLNTKTSEYLKSKSYALLNAKRYEEVISLEKIVNSVPFNKSNNKVISINIETAKKLSGLPINEVMLRNLIGQSKENDYKICAASLLDDEFQVKRLMKFELSRDYSKIYQYKRWPAIDEKHLQFIVDDLGKENVA